MGNKSFVFSFTDIEVREREFLLTKAGEVSPVEPKAFRVLLILLRNPQKLITKEELLNAVWGDAAVTENSLARSIALLRRLLGDDTRNPRYIETVATVGYRWLCKVQAAEDEAGGRDEADNSNALSEGDFVAASEDGNVTDAAAMPLRQIDTPDGGRAKSGAPDDVRTKSRSKLLLGGAILAFGLCATAWFAHRPIENVIASLTTPAPRVLRLAVSLPTSQKFVDYAGGNPVLFAPDGSAIVYSGLGPHGNQLYYRRLDQLEGTAIPGTEDSCCWAISPSGDWVAFGTPLNKTNNIWKVSLHGGAPIALGTAVYTGGLTFGPDDSIYSAESAAGLFRIPVNGGPKQRIAIPDRSKNEWSWAMPMALPDGKSVLAMSYKEPHETALVKIRVADGQVTELEGRGENPIGFAQGYLLFGRNDGKLGVVPFDPENTRTVEAVIPVMDSPLQRNSGLEAALSRAGDLVYVKAADRSRITFLDAQGHITGGNPVTGGSPDEHNFYPEGGIRVSPNGRQIVVREMADNVIRRGDLWVYDVASGVGQPLTNGANASAPEWTPDGHRVVYSVRPDAGPSEAWWVPADRSSPAERLIAMPNPIQQIVISPDSRYAVLTVRDPKAELGLYLVNLKGDRKPQPLETAPFDESSPEISPDGHWLTYVSDESGHHEVYVRPFPGGGAHVQVSADGGSDPRWGKNSREIVYRNADQFVIARLGSGGNVVVAQRDVLFSGPYYGYDLLPNGGIVALRPGSVDAEIIVVTNFVAELKAKLGKK